MMNAFWAFLMDSTNRQVLSWVSIGIVVVAGGLWAVVKFYYKKHDAHSTTNATATNHSVAIARDVINSPIDMSTRLGLTREELDARDEDTSLKSILTQFDRHAIHDQMHEETIFFMI